MKKEKRILGLPSFLSKSKFHKIDNLSLSQVITNVKDALIVEGKAMVGNEELSSYLSSKLGFDDDSHSIKNLVKAAILRAAGKGGIPQDLPDDTNLSDLFSDDAQYVLLTSYLEAIAKHFKPTATVSLAEVTACNSVQDVVDLITGKIK